MLNLFKAPPKTIDYSYLAGAVTGYEFAAVIFGVDCVRVAAATIRDRDPNCRIDYFLYHLLAVRCCLNYAKHPAAVTAHSTVAIS
jgi:hypothetical protein